MDKFPILNINKENYYVMSKMFKESSGFKAAMTQNYFVVGIYFVYALNYDYLVTFGKTLDQSEAFIRYTFTCHKMCTREIFL